MFKRGKIRFGPKDDEKKQFSRLTNGLLIQQLSLANSEVYFYDETILSMGTFVKKHWWKKGQESIIRLRRPTLMLRINMIVSREKVISFEIKKGKHCQEDVLRFLMVSSAHIKKTSCSKDPPVIVLDNGPKNRSRVMWSLATEGHFRPMFITPSTPEQNFIEVFFGAIKRRFSRFRNLNFVNEAPDPDLAFRKAALMAMSEATKEDFASCRSLFQDELNQLIFRQRFLP